MSNTNAQDSKFYIGLGAGYATAGGDGVEDGGYENGMYIKFLDMGLRLNETWGVTLGLASSTHTGEDIDDLDSLSIIADSTESICFSGYDGTGTRPTNTNTTERMRIDRYGKVGIGTSAPTERLHLMHWDQISTPIDRNQGPRK